MYKLIEMFLCTPDPSSERITEIHHRQQEGLKEYLKADYEPFQIEQVPSGTYYYLRKHMLLMESTDCGS